MGCEVNHAFADDSLWEKTVQVSRSWIGTPYRHMFAARGRGADCTMFLAKIFESVGILKMPKIEYYPKDWFIHTDQEIVLEGLASAIKHSITNGFYAEMFRFEGQEFLRGDLLCFALNKNGITNHAGMWLEDSRIIHSINNRGVSILTYRPALWNHRLTNIFRVYKGE